MVLGKDNLKNKLITLYNSVPKYLWILALIICVGIFLRTYHLHDWLKFRDDQARDASLVSQVVAGKAPWPLVGPYMSYSGIADHVEINSFHLGPIYYYFQIISAKIFGDYADKLAYLDVLLGILAIPLFYLFLRIYFKRNLSLGITGLFAISSYFIQYSRFAWNTNLIPFFVLLFLFSLHKFLEKNEETDWLWAILLGIAIGVGVQLHVIIMVLFISVSFFILLFSLKKNIRVWKKWALVLLVFLILNAGQIISELKTNFSNTKILLSAPSHNSSNYNPNVGKLTLIKNDIDCHMEANSYFLSSFGDSNCTYGFLKPASYGQKRTKNLFKFLINWMDKLPMLAAVAFSIFGYFLLIKHSKDETEKRKKYFLRLILFYSAAAFLIMIPLSTDTFNDLRYLTPIFFVPFILLGLTIEFISERVSNKKLTFILISAIFLLLIYTNGRAIFDQASHLLSKDRTCTSHSTTLGELEPVAGYLASNSGSQKLVYFGGDKALRVVYGPLAYILRKRNVDSVEIDPEPDHFQDKQSAYIVSCKSGYTDIYPYKEIGNIYVYQIN